MQVLSVFRIRTKAETNNNVHRVQSTEKQTPENGIEDIELIIFQRLDMLIETVTKS